MSKYFFIFIALAICSAGSVQAQNTAVYDIVIKGGHVIDPKNNINQLMDVAIYSARPARDGNAAQAAKIALVAKNIDTALAIQVVNAKGMFVTPGLIDIHTHVFYGPSKSNYLSNGSIAVVPDGHTFKAGVTTVVDAGGAGWKSFAMFKKNIIDLSE